MNIKQIKQLNNKIDKVIGMKKLLIFPIMGGCSIDLSIAGQPARNVTPKEIEILRSKQLPIPISIPTSREEEFQEYLKI